VSTLVIGSSLDERSLTTCSIRSERSSSESRRSADFALDLEALDQTPYSLVMLAKTESSVQVDALAARGHRAL